jgi:hypothetical protein
MISKLCKLLTRRVNPVNFPDLHRVTPVSPIFGLDRGTPIDRYYIEKFLKASSGYIAGQVLEVGNSHYSKRFGGAGITCKVLHATEDNPAATVVGDLTDRTTLPGNITDCFICTQTLNFIFDVESAVAGIHHILKPGGVLLATVAGISQISRYDMERWGDYWRFTTASLEKLFKPVFPGAVEIGIHGNSLAACAFLQGLAVEDLPDPRVLDETDPAYQLLLTITARKDA